MNTINKILAIILLFRKIFARHTKRITLMIGLGFIGGFLGGIGIGAIIPIFYIITNQSVAGTDFISHIISKIFGFINLPLTLPTIIVLMAILFVTKAVFLYIANHINTKIYVDYELETRERLFKKTLETDWPY